MKTDLILAAAVAALPWLSMNSAFEAKRLGLLAGVYAVVAVLRHFRLIRGEGGAVAVGLTMLMVGWLESFPAWNHSAEIGTYVLSGTAIVALGVFRAARRSQPVRA